MTTPYRPRHREASRDHAPWIVDPERDAVAARPCPGCVARSRLDLPGLTTTDARSPGRAGGPHRPAPRHRARPLGRRRPPQGRSRVDRRPVPPPPRGRRAASGPTYIKLGQIISSGEGIFPEELVSEFKKCRDQVPPEPFARGAPAWSRRTSAGRSRRCSPASTPTPLAAASIAQVHLATLLTGEEVVVKVQRPSVGELVHRDLRVMAWIAPVPRRPHPRSPRWPTRRRSSSCSPRRSPRSSTSASRPRTCSTWPGPSPTSASATT